MWALEYLTEANRDEIEALSLPFKVELPASSANLAKEYFDRYGVGYEEV